MIIPRLTQQMKYIESTLEKTEWLAGNEFTAADIQMAIPLIWAAEDKQLINNHPKINGFIERIKTRPAFVRAVNKGGSIARISRKS